MFVISFIHFLAALQRNATGVAIITLRLTSYQYRPA
jgi:hypothetical protein